MASKFLEFRWWKLILIIIVIFVLFILYLYTMPICGFPPTMENPPRCASTLTDVLLGMIIIISLYLIITIIYSIYLKFRKQNIQP
jgi:uncharacterized metal-binding protein